MAKNIKGWWRDHRAAFDGINRALRDKNFKSALLLVNKISQADIDKILTESKNLVNSQLRFVLCDTTALLVMHGGNKEVRQLNDRLNDLISQYRTIMEDNLDDYTMFISEFVTWATKSGILDIALARFIEKGFVLPEVALGRHSDLHTFIARPPALSMWIVDNKLYEHVFNVFWLPYFTSPKCGEDMRTKMAGSAMAYLSAWTDMYLEEKSKEVEDKKLKLNEQDFMALIIVLDQRIRYLQTRSAMDRLDFNIQLVTWIREVPFKAKYFAPCGEKILRTFFSESLIKELYAIE